MMIVAIVAVVIIIGVALYLYKEKFQMPVNVELKASPNLINVAKSLDMQKLSSFIQKYLPNSNTPVIVPVSLSDLSYPFTGSLVFTDASTGKSLSFVPIASATWYKTQNLSLEQLEDSLYNNPRVLETLKNVRSM